MKNTHPEDTLPPSFVNEQAVQKRVGVGVDTQFEIISQKDEALAENVAAMEALRHAIDLPSQVQMKNVRAGSLASTKKW